MLRPDGSRPHQAPGFQTIRAEPRATAPSRAVRSWLVRRCEIRRFARRIAMAASAPWVGRHRRYAV